ncbi:MAG: T9SS type A sorting domain-containing protein [Saprospiraceae bacterium]|nr:T9SS type A sorting domain-containing protein [Saprospiraceae bacterium]
MQIFDGFVYARKHSGGTIRTGDFGATWQWVHTDRFVFIADGDQMFRSKEKAIFRSSDGGFTWDTLLTFPQNVSLEFKQGHTFIVKNGFQTNTASISEDGGTTWQTFSATANDFNHIDVLLPFQGKLYAFGQVSQRAWVANAAIGKFEEHVLPPETYTAFGVLSTGNEIFRATIFNGVLRSMDATNWTKCEGLNDGQITQLKIYAGQMYAATHSGLYRLLPDKHHWEPLAPQYEMRQVKDVVVEGNNIAISAWAGQVWYSEDGGQAFQWATNADGSPVWDIERMEKMGNQIIGWSDFPAIKVPRISYDFGKTWKSLYPQLAGLNVITFSASNGVLYLLNHDGRLFRWDTGNEAFVLFSNTPVPFSSNPSVSSLDYWSLYVKDNVCIVAQPLEYTPDEGYHFFVSTDSGQTWTEHPRFTTTGIYKDYRWNDVEMSGDTIFVALQNNGVYFSTDFGENWLPFSEGLWSKSAEVFALFEGELFMGQSGVYRRKTNGELPTVSSTEPPLTINLSVSPNPFYDHFTIRLSNPALAAEVRLFDMLGRQIEVPKNKLSDVEIQLFGMGQLPIGIYFLEIKDGKSKRVKRILKM